MIVKITVKTIDAQVHKLENKVTKNNIQREPQHYNPQMFKLHIKEVHKYCRIYVSI